MTAQGAHEIRAGGEPGERPVSIIHSTRLQVVLYALLLIVTPFLMIRRYLQDAIGRLSRLSAPIGGFDLPLVPTAAGLALLALVLAYRRRITRGWVLAGGLAIAMIAFAQQIGDNYFAHRFYDLQMNWHYIAYGLFAWVVWRDLAPRGVRLSRIMLVTAIVSLVFSTIDETFQYRISSRVFDTGDIAKDVWGALTGILFLMVALPEGASSIRDWRPLRRPTLRETIDHPAGLLAILLGFGVIFLSYGSLLSDPSYALRVFALTGITFLLFLAAFQLSRIRWVGIGLAVALGAAAVLLVASCARNWSHGVVAHRPGVVSYRGLPIVYFDAIIFPDGSFRLADKKTFFNQRDQWFLLSKKPDIVVLATGPDGTGGKGFPVAGAPQHFVYNDHTGRAAQVITLPNAEALPLYNRLKREGKNVLFVLHNTD